MAEIEIRHCGNRIVELNSSAEMTLLTGGKYNAGNIELKYTKPSYTPPVIEPLAITENGTYTAPEGVDGFDPVTVNVSSTDPLEYCIAAPHFANSYPSAAPVINALLCTDFSDLFYNDGALKYTDITVISNANVTDISGAFNRYWGSNPNLKTVTLNIRDLSRVKTYFNMIKNAVNFESLNGTPLDFTNVTSTDNSRWFAVGGSTYGSGTISARYKANTLHVNHNISAARFDNTSLVSIANGLQAGARTITLHADNKAQCQTIMGTVADGVFTADAVGTVTLESFITQTKGWTIA